MTLKGYLNLAAKLKPVVESALKDDPNHGGHGIVKNMLDAVCAGLKDDNHHFDEGKFLVKCGWKSK